AGQGHGAPGLLHFVPVVVGQALEHGLDAALAGGLRWPQGFHPESALLVLGADAPVSARLLVRWRNRTKLVAAGGRRIAAGLAVTGQWQPPCGRKGTPRPPGDRNPRSLPAPPPRGVPALEHGMRAGRRLRHSPSQAEMTARASSTPDLCSAEKVCTPTPSP